MLSWPALLLAPLVALAQQSIAYSLVQLSCETQTRGGLHAVSVVAVLLVAVMTAMAWQGWRHQASSLRDDGSAARQGGPAVSAAESHQATYRPPFVALLAVLVGALSLLVTVSLWIPIWFLSPCS
jgi:hypothetical protein